MNLNYYFDPVDLIAPLDSEIDNKSGLISNISVHSLNNNIEDNIEEFNIAILGLPNEKFADGKNLLKIREYLYNLSSYYGKNPKIIDLGNLKTGKTSNDLIIGLRDVFAELFVLNIVPIIIGPSEEIIYSNYLAYKKISKKVTLGLIDSKIDIKTKKGKNTKSVLNKILIEENDSLFSFLNIGYQTHFVNKELLKFLSGRNHFYYRLGYTRPNIKEVESILRDTDIIGLNISSIKQSEAFGQKFPSPNGYYAEEICQLAKYAGLSDKLSTFGIYDYYANSDINNQTAHLIAQIIWYFIDGYNNRFPEYPLENEKDYKKFIVNLDSSEYELIFYKSEKTGRWWVVVPSFKYKEIKNLLIACTYEDYINAGNGDVPERWLKYYQKIN